MTEKNEIRCKKCNGLLLKGEIVDIEIKCRKCGYVSKIWTSDSLRFVDIVEMVREKVM